MQRSRTLPAVPGPDRGGTQDAVVPTPEEPADALPTRSMRTSDEPDSAPGEGRSASALGADRGGGSRWDVPPGSRGWIAELRPPACRPEGRLHRLQARAHVARMPG